MKTRTMLLAAAAFAVVSVAPQAIAQSCNAMPTNFGNRFQTQPNDRRNPRISIHTATSGADSLYVGYSEEVAAHAGLKLNLPAVGAELPLASLTNRYLASSSRQSPGRSAAPQTNWCYLVCTIIQGGNPDDCGFMCDGKRKPQ